ncbi:MAG TPA: PAS domain-containing protein [Herpetosiphonaceae bacterium]
MNADPNEVIALRQRVAELEQQVQAAHALGQALQQKTLEQEALLQAIPALVYVKDRQHHYLAGSQAFLDMIGTSMEDLVGKTDAEIFPPDLAELYLTSDEEIMASGQPIHNFEAPLTRPDGCERWITAHNVPLRNAQGDVIGMVGAALDVTERRQAEEALRQSEARLRAVIEQQERLLETINELSTPVMPIADRILVLPLVGHIDTNRGVKIMEVLLESVHQSGAAFVIIDITGVPVIDTAVANRILQAAEATKLLGAQCVLVGISPEIAQTLVQLGVTLQALVTCSNLHAGIAYALAQQGLVFAARATHARTVGGAQKS